MKYFLCLILIAFATNVFGQRVGLVLSGGAAKGLAHVGVLKALEENDIPVDYIVGTSMGGIVGGIYAAGISPGQIEEIVTSEKFLRWVKGLPEEGYNYFYHKSNPDPGFLQLDLALDSTLNVQFNSSLANDVSLNFALTEQFAQASAISKNNFDSLFVPLRVVAADIFTQQQVVLSKGLLSNALRATQTVPFFYTPIRVEGKYLFDGGVYNNFPVDVAREQFNPDVIIGVNVSTKVFEDYPYDKDDRLISHSLIYMLLDKSDPRDVGENGIYIQPDVSDFTSFNFDRARSLIDSGYVQTLRQIDEIKAKIKRRVSCDEVYESRNRFNNKSYPFVFDGLTFHGFNEKQSKYIRRVFGINPHKPKLLYRRDISKGYFELVSEDYFANVFPNILFDTTKHNFNLQLSRRPRRNFLVDFGGVIATREISNIFLGLNYYYFNKSLAHFFMGFQTGSFYRNATARVRIDNPFITKFYIEPAISFTSWDYLTNEDLFQNVTSTVLKRTDRQAAVNFGWPVSDRFKSVISIKGFNNTDRYSNDEGFVSSDTLDRMQLRGIKSTLMVSSNTLNRKQYPSAGSAISLAASYFNVEEYYQPGNTSVQSGSQRSFHQWFQLRFSAEQYFSKGFYRPGYFVEGVFSNQPTFQNYFGTIINAPAFLPLQDSPTLLLENFRSFNYVAGGIRNVFTLRNKLDFRIEAYLFKPFDYLTQNEDQEVVENSELSQVYLAATAGLVHHSPIGPISLSVNYYDDKENQLGVLLHVGFLLYNKHTLE
ncbi:MAG TPA: patatin-like phospholipase family protein [Cyclobacteriaceae bacterium]|nr:patatin-like phospholipase family protein [Cyclobacteriaceae bacterium]